MNLGIKEIITYISCVLGLVLICIAKVKFQKRQQQFPDNQYSENEKKILNIGYVFTGLALILALIPIY